MGINRQIMRGQDLKYSGLTDKSRRYAGFLFQFHK